MVHVRISTSFPGYPLVRQTPGWNGVWGQYRFFVDEPIERCDYWVVYDNLDGPQKAACRAENTVFISGEPPSLRRYPSRFLSQFATVITCHRDVKHPNSLFRHQAIPWHVGTGGYHTRSREGVFLDYDKLAAMTPADLPKSRLLSVISSAKSQTRGHQLRLDFVGRLKAALGDEVDVYGFGIREVADKWETIAPYKYHVAIENSAIDDYWTEKLADTFLGGALPIYHGAPNIGKYFEAGALVPVDIRKPEAAVAKIKTAVEADTFEKSAAALARARKTVLDRYNLFPMLVDLLDQRRQASGADDVAATAGTPAGPLQLRPIQDFEGVKRKIVRTVARYIPRAIKRRLK
jgi:hypothetical protein